MFKDEIIGNLSTIIKILLLTYLPAQIVQYIDPNLLYVLITAIIGFLFAIVDAYFQNTFQCFGNNQKPDVNTILGQPIVLNPDEVDQDEVGTESTENDAPKEA